MMPAEKGDGEQRDVLAGGGRRRGGEDRRDRQIMGLAGGWWPRCALLEIISHRDEALINHAP